MKRKTLPFLLLAIVLGLTFTSFKKEATNGNPVVSSVAVAPSSVNANGIATVTVTATDPNGDALTYSYSVTGGAITGSGATAS